MNICECIPRKRTAYLPQESMIDEAKGLQEGKLAKDRQTSLLCALVRQDVPCEIRAISLATGLSESNSDYFQMKHR